MKTENNTNTANGASDERYTSFNEFWGNATPEQVSEQLEHPITKLWNDLNNRIISIVKFRMPITYYKNNETGKVTARQHKNSLATITYRELLQVTEALNKTLEPAKIGLAIANHDERELKRYKKTLDALNTQIDRLINANQQAIADEIKQWQKLDEQAEQAKKDGAECTTKQLLKHDKHPHLHNPAMQAFYKGAKVNGACQTYGKNSSYETTLNFFLQSEELLENFSYLEINMNTYVVITGYLNILWSKPKRTKITDLKIAYSQVLRACLDKQSGENLQATDQELNQVAECTLALRQIFMQGKAKGLEPIHNLIFPAKEIYVEDRTTKKWERGIRFYEEPPILRLARLQNDGKGLITTYYNDVIRLMLNSSSRDQKNRLNDVKIALLAIKFIEQACSTKQAKSKNSRANNFNRYSFKSFSQEACLKHESAYKKRLAKAKLFNICGYRPQLTRKYCNERA